MKVLGKSYFTEYLPPKIFKNLKRDEKKNYREYRRWYRLLGDTKNDIDNKTNQIKKLKEEISELKYTLQDRKDKLDYFSIPINHLMDNFSFTCSITMRDKTSKSYKINKKVESGELHSLEGFYGQTKSGRKSSELKTQYGGKKLTQKKKLYCSVVSKGNVYRKNIYVGSEVDVRKFLTEVVYKDFDRDIMKDSLDFVKQELKDLYQDYIRDFISKNNWVTLKETSSHNLSVLEKWYKRSQNSMNEDIM